MRPQPPRRPTPAERRARPGLGWSPWADVDPTRGSDGTPRTGRPPQAARVHPRPRGHPRRLAVTAVAARELAVRAARPITGARRRRTTLRRHIVPGRPRRVSRRPWRSPSALAGVPAPPRVSRRPPPIGLSGQSGLSVPGQSARAVGVTRRPLACPCHPVPAIRIDPATIPGHRTSAMGDRPVRLVCLVSSIRPATVALPGIRRAAKAAPAPSCSVRRRRFRLAV